jgi:hypothetical protein
MSSRRRLPILFEDAGKEHAQIVCHSFPGGIAWWEGQNVFNSSFFGEDVMAPEYEFEIYIKEYDNNGLHAG